MSPDHGIGTDIIGKGIANPKSFKNAIKFLNKYNV
jgi:4-hydroxy-L-threonine phosphate dehydrogenase PdxA